jgi:nitrite reductase/ring-hydroxylating ferredoxin subunit
VIIFWNPLNSSEKHPNLIQEATMNWTNVLSESELPEGARRVVTADGRELLLIHREGKIHAVSNHCTHMRAKMEKGEVTDENTIVCPRHRSAFDLGSGAVEAWVPWPPVVGRALSAISQENALPVFPTKVEDGSIWVAVEETKAA